MKRQDVILEMEADYAGHPYYVTGNAILHALAHSGAIDADTQQALRISHGVFCPSAYGVFPDWHSQSGGRMSFPSTLKPTEAYEDLFLFRRPDHEWLHPEKARSAYNTPSIRRLGDRYAIQPSQAVQARTGEKPRQSQWYIHCYLTQAEGADVLPLREPAFDGIQLGGKRNYGYGTVSCKDSMVTDTNGLDFSRIQGADTHVIELVTPYVIESEYPNTEFHDVPWWWDSNVNYRTRTEQLVQQQEQYRVKVCDHGQVTRYEGREPVETARNGISRVGLHNKYGFGELMIRPA